MTETYPCPVCKTPCHIVSASEAITGYRPAGLTMQELRDWLRDEARTSHLQAEEVYDGGLNVHYERYLAFEEIIAIIDERKLP